MAGRQNLQENLDQIVKLIEQIQCQIRHRDKETLSMTSLYRFEAISLPFQLVQEAIALCAAVFPPESLGEIATTDEESINAWAIALMQTLQSQLTLVEHWQPPLATLPLPSALKEKIRDRTTDLQQIRQKHAEILQSTASLFATETQLRQDAQALQQLKKKAKLLQAIKTELQTTDLNALREQISLETEAIAPQRQYLETLKQQQTELETELTSLEQQRVILENQINYLQEKRQNLETTTHQQVNQLITLTAAEKQRLSQELNSVLADLSSQQQEYQQIQQQLATAIAESNRYQQETEKLREYLRQHYQSNQELGKNLPVNQPKIDSMVKIIEQNLAQLDQELAQALQQQEVSQQKTIFTFN
jgi:hypothetical protein